MLNWQRDSVSNICVAMCYYLRQTASRQRRRDALLEVSRSVHFFQGQHKNHCTNISSLPPLKFQKIHLRGDGGAVAGTGFQSQDSQGVAESNTAVEETLWPRRNAESRGGALRTAELGYLTQPNKLIGVLPRQSAAEQENKVNPT